MPQRPKSKSTDLKAILALRVQQAQDFADIMRAKSEQVVKLIEQREALTKEIAALMQEFHVHADEVPDDVQAVFDSDPDVVAVDVYHDDPDDLDDPVAPEVPAAQSGGTYVMSDEDKVDDLIEEVGTTLPGGRPKKEPFATPVAEMRGVSLVPPPMRHDVKQAAIRAKAQVRLLAEGPGAAELGMDPDCGYGDTADDVDSCAHDAHAYAEDARARKLAVTISVVQARGHVDVELWRYNSGW